MNTFLTRPPVSELHFQSYGRSLHPELFDILAVRRVERDGYQLAVQITRTGHCISWRYADQCVTEAADAVADLAQSRRLLSYRLRGEHAATVRLSAGLTLSSELSGRDARARDLPAHSRRNPDRRRQRGLLHNFQTNHRLGLSPLGYVCVETRPGCLFWSAFHTFPEEFTVIKSQTLLEMKKLG